MDNTLYLEVLECRNDLFCVAFDFLFFEKLTIFHLRFERLLLAELHQDVDVSFIFELMLHFYDIIVVCICVDSHLPSQLRFHRRINLFKCLLTNTLKCVMVSFMCYFPSFSKASLPQPLYFCEDAIFAAFNHFGNDSEVLNHSIYI
jgi:hypothetical protein